MKILAEFRSFFWLIVGIFLFNWFAMVVFPWLELGHLPSHSGRE